MKNCVISLEEITLSKGSFEVKALMRVKIINIETGTQQGNLSDVTFTSRLNEINHTIIPEKIKICDIEIEKGAENR